ncbi:hypothetical protein BSK48_30520, partial [Paenibacillus odorifer]|uniref:hypothetical protein n=1 Tax=Paenibacillus odorifer TaxID=189426 RepID=UPI00097A5051
MGFMGFMGSMAALPILKQALGGIFRGNPAAESIGFSRLYRTQKTLFADLAHFLNSIGPHSRYHPVKQQIRAT